MARSVALGLARGSCRICHGLGVRDFAVRGRGEYSRVLSWSVCDCAWRAVWRACYGRFRLYVASGPGMGSPCLTFTPGWEGKRSYTRKRENYLADFCLVSRRELVAGSLAHRLFVAHFLLGGDWRACCRGLHMERGDFFHEVYRVEVRLGRVFYSLEPYGLWPVREYMGGVVDHARELEPVA